METRLIIASDVHLCHVDWLGRSSADRMEALVRDLKEHYAQHPYETVLFLGDYSLDFWAWDVGGSYVREGVSNTRTFVRDYASRLPVPFRMLPGNHEQYGDVLWQEITGDGRQFYFTLGGYLFICCDTFAGDLDPDRHHDGVYTPVELDFVRKAMVEHPALPVILCAHWFDAEKETEAFRTFLQEEPRVTALFCGHDHLNFCENWGTEADPVPLYHDGAYSYTGAGKTPREQTWGFCEVTLTEEGVEIVYLSPAHTVTLEDGTVYEHPYQEQTRVFCKRRDRK